MVKDKLIEHANKLLNWTDSATQFVADEAPEYVQELITFKMLDSIVSLVVFFSIIVIVAFIGWLVNKNISKQNKGAPYTIAGIIIFLMLLFAMTSLTEQDSFMFGNIRVIIKAKYAPRVLIVDELKATIKGAK